MRQAGPKARALCALRVEAVASTRPSGPGRRDRVKRQRPGFDSGRAGPPGRGLAAVPGPHRSGTFDGAGPAARLERVPERHLEDAGAGYRVVLSRGRRWPRLDHDRGGRFAARPGLRPRDGTRGRERRSLPSRPLRRPQSQEQPRVADAHCGRRPRLRAFRRRRHRGPDGGGRDRVAHTPSIRVPARRRRIAGAARRPADRQLRRQRRRRVRRGARRADGKDPLENVRAARRPTRRIRRRS